MTKIEKSPNATKSLCEVIQQNPIQTMCKLNTVGAPTVFNFNALVLII